MSNLPEFKDFDKSVTDLLGDDFGDKYLLKIKTAGPCTTTVTTTTTWCAKDNCCLLVPKLGLKWLHPTSGFTLEKLEISQDSKISVETSLSNISPGLKVEFKGNDSDKADLSVTYSIPQATIFGELDAHNLSGAKVSVLGGHSSFTGGANAEIKFGKTSGVDQTVFALGVGYRVPKLFVGARACKNFSHYSATASYDATNELVVAGKVNYNSKDTSATLLSQYKCCPNTTIKVKADTSGVFSASVKQVLDKKFTVVGSAELPSSFNTVKFGVSATLG